MSAVIGGAGNDATGEGSVVVGGLDNGTAPGVAAHSAAERDRRWRVTRTNGEQIAAVVGDSNNSMGDMSVVTVAPRTSLAGASASVSGGFRRTAEDADDWVAGSLFEDK